MTSLFKQLFPHCAMRQMIWPVVTNLHGIYKKSSRPWDKVFLHEQHSDVISLKQQRWERELPAVLFLTLNFPWPPLIIKPICPPRTIGSSWRSQYKKEFNKPVECSGISPASNKPSTLELTNSNFPLRSRTLEKERIIEGHAPSQGCCNFQGTKTRH